LLKRAFGYLDQYGPDQRAILHFETELARITGVQGAKSNAAVALAHLFGRLPSSRPALLKLLASDKDGS
jgi:DNA repair protein RecO (recombination protein O)